MRLDEPDKRAIFCDLDGTLVNILEQLQQYMWNRWQVCFPVECVTQYDLHEPVFKYIMHTHNYDAPKGFPTTVGAFRTELVERFWSNPGPYLQAAPYYSFWQELRGWKGRLCFVTARSFHLNEVTRQWLERWGFPHVETWHTKDKVSDLGKLSVEYEGANWKQMFIADKAEDVVAAQHWYSWMKCILVASPWNVLPPVGPLRKVKILRCTRLRLAQSLRAFSK